MTSRASYTLTLAAAAAMLPAIVSCQGETAGGFVSRLFSISVLPTERPDGAYTITPGGESTVRLEIRMGTNVEGTITVRISALPGDVTTFFPVIYSPLVRSDETYVMAIELAADEFAVPGTYRVRFDAEGSIDFVGTSGEETENQTLRFTLIVLGSAEGGDGDGDEASGADGEAAPDADGSASCTEYVDYYNGLDCVSEPLDEASTCSGSVGESCTGEEEFNACRIRDTFCDEAGTLIENIDECFALLDCS